MKNNINVLITFLIYIVINTIFFYSLFAQDMSNDSSTVIINQNTRQDSSKVSVKSPRTAMICSLVFPGLGQLYNGKKFKALMICGLEFGLLANSIDLNQKYKTSTDFDSKEFFINNRNLSTWWLVGSILYSILDAFVDAHLHNFDESPDLSININPYQKKQTIMLSLSVPF